MVGSCASGEDTPSAGTGETLLVALVLVAAFHAIPYWLVKFLPLRELYDRLGEQGFATLYDALSGIVPLLLCLGAPLRCGLSFGRWKGHALKVLGVCALPILVTGIIYPITSQPFSGGRVGSWLVSPAAQDLLFAGYLYGRFDAKFPGAVNTRVRVHRAVLFTAGFFALWHVPNVWGMSAAYVSFQLVYTLIGGAWMLLARQITGSVIPGIVTHMACNFIAWL